MSIVPGHRFEPCSGGFSSKGPDLQLSTSRYRLRHSRLHRSRTPHCGQSRRPQLLVRPQQFGVCWGGCSQKLTTRFRDLGKHDAKTARLSAFANPSLQQLRIADNSGSTNYWPVPSFCTNQHCKLPTCVFAGPKETEMSIRTKSRRLGSSNSALRTTPATPTIGQHPRKKPMRNRGVGLEGEQAVHGGEACTRDAQDGQSCDHGTDDCGDVHVRGLGRSGLGGRVFSGRGRGRLRSLRL